MRFAKVEIDPRAEETPEHGVHHERWEKIRMLPRQAHMPDSELGLRCIRFVNDMKPSHSRARRCRQLRLTSRSRWPFFKGAGNHHSSPIGCDVAGKNYSRITCPIVCTVELFHIGA